LITPAAIVVLLPPIALAQPPSNPEGGQVVPLQAAKKTARENLTAIQSRLPAISTKLVKEIAEKHLQVGLHNPVGVVEVATMSSETDGKVTLVFSERVKEPRIEVLTIQLKHFDGYWTSTSFDCSWTKAGGWTESTLIPHQGIMHSGGFRNEALNKLALLIMAHIDKRP
jgi:hypothetical protein